MAETPESPRPSDDLDARLRAARAREEIESGRVRRNQGGTGSGVGFGFRIAMDLLAATGCGAVIGYGLDQLCDTRPWLMVVFLFLGAAAGLLNAYRAAKGLDSSVGLGAAQRRRDRERERSSDGS